MALEVDADDGVPLLLGHREAHGVAQDPRVVHQDVEVAEASTAWPTTPRRPATSDVVVVGVASPPRRSRPPPPGGRLVARLLLACHADVVDDDLRAFGRQQQRLGAADTASTPSRSRLCRRGRPCSLPFRAHKPADADLTDSRVRYAGPVTEPEEETHGRRRHRLRRPHRHRHGRKGSLVDVDAFDLGKFAVGEALKRSGIPADDVDDIVLGEVLQGGGDIARYVAVELGLDRRAGRSPTTATARRAWPSVQTAAASIRAGMDRVVIAGGAESITQLAAGVQEAAGQLQRRAAVAVAEPPGDARRARPATCRSRSGGTPRRSANVTREEQDDWAYHSHMRADRRDRRGSASRTRSSRSRSPAGKGETRDLRRRRAPAPRHHDGEARRAAAAAPGDPRLLDHRGQLVGPQRRLVARWSLCDADYAKAHGLEPLAIVRSWASAGVAAGRHRPRARRSRSRRRSTAPGSSVDDVDLVEINEAFASMAVASQPHPRLPARDRERERQRLQPRPPGRVHRRPHDHHAASTSCAGAVVASASRACAPAAAWARRP